MESKKKNFTKTILTTLALGLVSGIAFISLREFLIYNGHQSIWTQINLFLFADITAAGNENAIGLLFMIGQIFIRLLQMVLIPLIFTSIIKAIQHIQDTSLLNKLAKNGFINFALLLTIALSLATIVGFSAYQLGWFQLTNLASIEVVASTANKSNPLLLILNAFNPNILAALSNNGNIIAVIMLALLLGTFMQQLKKQVQTLTKIIDELYLVTMKILEFVIAKIAPVAIYCLLVRTFAAYGIQYLRPAFAYMTVTATALLILLYLVFPIIIYVKTGLNPFIFMKKISKIAAFGFSTSSSAATLPLSQETIIHDLGVSESVASFIGPLASTINMTGTAIMQVIATLFIASAAGYQIGLVQMASILVLTVIGSISTPAAPGAGAILLFTIISGMGFVNPGAMAAYSFILAINRPVEMLVTAVNVVDDSVIALCVAHDLDQINTVIYNQETEERKLVKVN